jgi:predicted TIM-barrel fold metal-dependent hydrolase
MWIRDAGASSKSVLRRMVDLYGADRVMWGSDIGTSAGAYHEMVTRALDACALLTDTERRAVMYETGRRVFAARSKPRS